MTFTEYKAKIFAECPEVKKEYDALGPYYEKMLAKARKKAALARGRKNTKAKES